ncbi:MAG: hypothetical protein HY073_04110, partial [Deltaproteobacteria bacterium]|nr:hypothetical protein [Deltaproteobacteria bacterium]
MKRPIALLLLLLISHSAFAGPTMAVLEYRHQETLKDETQKLTDRIREELERRFGQAILSQDETAGMFYYHKQGVLQEKANQSRET